VRIDTFAIRGIFTIKGEDMRMFKTSIRVPLLMLAVVAVAGCVDAPTEDEAREGDVAAETAEVTLCPTLVSDETEPAVAQALEGATWESIGEPTVQRVDGKRVSRAHFQVKTSGDVQGKLPVTVECTSTCGSGFSCSGHGCDASQWGCSSFTCMGSQCTGGCTKKSTFTPDP
jgi:hypothetical protein